jgi:hypothetical protein
MELSRSYKLLQDTLTGNIITINRSQAAQIAYTNAMNNGKNQQEAMGDAQRAFADENKTALSLFNELTQMSGIKGPQFDKMRADLLVNFARTQGMGLENNPMFQNIIKELRKDPAQRAAEDPVLKRLVAQADAIKQAQIDAVSEQNKIDRDIQQKLLTDVANNLIKQIELKNLKSIDNILEDTQIYWNTIRKNLRWLYILNKEQSLTPQTTQIQTQINILDDIKQLNTGNKVYIKLEGYGTVVATVYREDNVVYIHRFMIDENFQGKGYGKLAFKELLNYLNFVFSQVLVKNLLDIFLLIIDFFLL